MIFNTIQTELNRDKNDKVPKLNPLKTMDELDQNRIYGFRLNKIENKINKTNKYIIIGIWIMLLKILL